MKTGFLELAEDDLRAHTVWLRQLAVRLLREGAAEDAVQDTWVAALQHPPAVDRDVRPWLARVLTNFTRSRRRADRRREQREVAAGGPQRSLGADELLERHEATRVVAAEVSRLTEPHRALVLLRYAEGVAPKEIARQRGVPEGTVRRQLKTAMDQLRAAVAAHYQKDRRDWRMALAPLVPADNALMAAGQGVTLMAAKGKMMLGMAAAALVLALLLAGWRWSARDDRPDTVAASGAPPGSSSLSAGARSEPRSRPRPEGAPSGSSPASPPPPIFTTQAAAVDPARCPEKLAELRALASRRALPLSPEAFASARPSPSNERQVAPIVQRVLGQLPGKPSFQLECRASLCRVGVISEREDNREGPSWMRALSEDSAFAALRGSNRSSRVDSMPTRDALTGTTLQQHWLYFNVPLAAGEEHPFEASAGPTATCGERVAALQMALEHHRDEERTRQQEITERRRRFEAQPVNVELTRRLQAASPMKSPESGAPIGVWECRGQADCRWKGPASAMRMLDRDQLRAGLAAQGLSAARVMARLQPPAQGKPGEQGVPPEGELTLQLGSGDEPIPAGEPRARRQVIVESVSTERPPP
jgi:RNA polymerase sigma-70 factor (ECF subfamily)